MIVSPARRIVSAISLGVFCRSAPSTSAIIRSRKVCPGSAVTRIVSRSDRTRVPPVTAERSPPDSRMTGADSPVIADSSTAATPSITSPSTGISSPASTRQTSPMRRLDAATSSKAPSSRTRRACASVRPRRSVAACALPRPSAMASAKLAKRTVSQSHAVTWSSKPSPGRPSTTSRTRAALTRALPASTTNITGFPAIARGLNLTTAAFSAPATMARSQIGLAECRVISTPVPAPSTGARRSAPG